jgi:capsular polysaccharide biosynthesis protein
MYVSAQVADTATAAYQGSLLSQQRVSSYVKLVSSTRVSREVIRDLALTGTPEAVAGQVSASTAPDSVLIEVAVVGRAPVEVAALADSVGRAFTDLVAELERPSTPDGVAPVVVRVVQPATVPTMPSSPGLPVPLLLGLPGGAAVGAGLALARNAMDTSIRTPEQLHTAVQAPNLGTIA